MYVYKFIGKLKESICLRPRFYLCLSKTRPQFRLKSSIEQLGYYNENTWRSNNNRWKWLEWQWTDTKQTRGRRKSRKNATIAAKLTKTEKHRTVIEMKKNHTLYARWWKENVSEKRDDANGKNWYFEGIKRDCVQIHTNKQTIM